MQTYLQRRLKVIKLSRLESKMQAEHYPTHTVLLCKHTCRSYLATTVQVSHPPVKMTEVESSDGMEHAFLYRGY